MGTVPQLLKIRRPIPKRVVRAMLSFFIFIRVGVVIK
jgi:hypothetical protein